MAAGVRPTPFVRALAFGELSLYNAFNAKHNPTKEQLNQYSNMNIKRIYKMSLEYMEQQLVSSPMAPSTDEIEMFISNPGNRNKYALRIAEPEGANFFAVLDMFFSAYDVPKTKIEEALNLVHQHWPMIKKMKGALSNLKPRDVLPVKPMASFLHDLTPVEHNAYISILNVIIPTQRKYVLAQLDRIQDHFKSEPHNIDTFYNLESVNVGDDNDKPKRDRMRDMLNVMKQLQISSKMAFDNITSYKQLVTKKFKMESISETHAVNLPIPFVVMKHYLTDIFDIYQFLFDIAKRYTDFGSRYVSQMRDKMSGILTRFPAWPMKLRWDKGVVYEDPLHSNVAPWPVSTLVESATQAEFAIRPEFYQMSLCRRGAIASLLAALDANHHAHTFDGDKRFVSAYSVVIIVLRRNKYSSGSYDPTLESGSYTCIAIHARALELNREDNVSLARVYDVYDGTHNLLYHVTNEAKMFTPFVVDSLVFDQIRAPYEHSNAPVMQFRVLRLQSDLDLTAGKDPFAIEHIVGITPSKKIHVVAQYEMGRGYGYACTSFAAAVALFLFNGYDKLLDVDDSPERRQLIAKIKTEMAAIYAKACALGGVEHGEMTVFYPSMGFQTPSNLAVTSFFTLNNEVQRSSRLFDKPHPLVQNIEAGPEATPLLDMFYSEPLAKMLDNAHSLLFQEIWTLIHSPMLIEYDERVQSYKMAAVAFGITMRNNHSILIFVAQVTVDMQLPLNLLTRRFMVYDSSGGDLLLFDSLLQLEEYFVPRYGSPVKTFRTNTDLYRFLASTQQYVENETKPYFDKNVFAASTMEERVTQSQLDFVNAAHFVHDNTDIPESRVDDLLGLTVAVDYKIWRHEAVSPEDFPVQSLPAAKGRLINPETLHSSELEIIL